MNKENSEKELKESKEYSRKFTQCNEVEQYLLLISSFYSESCSRLKPATNNATKHIHQQTQRQPSSTNNSNPSKSIHSLS
jgi:hypothetical protein